MASFILEIRDETLKSEIEAAFQESFSNPDNLTGEGLVILHLENLVKSVLNEARRKALVDAAEASAAAIKEDTLA